MSQPAEVADAAQEYVAAIAAACIDPSDALRLLTELAAFTDPPVPSSTVVGIAIADMKTATVNLFRRSAAIALARAATKYQPSSYDDAANVRAAICQVLDDEIVSAGDLGQDASYKALRTLRAAVVQDLTTRGANLAPTRVYTERLPLPSIVLATKYYRDPARADDLVVQADPVHPLFMPVSFRALSN